MMTKLKAQNSKLKTGFQKGFTLIELMVVLGVTAVLGTLGIAGFSTYNEVQTLQSSADDLVTVLNVAKSKAQSQIKPPSPDSNCDSPRVLMGYSVALDTSGPGDNTYKVDAICSDADDVIVCNGDPTNVIPSKSLLPKIEFVSRTNPTEYCFPTLIGGVLTGGQIKLGGYGREKTIIIDLTGGVSIQ